MLLLRTQDHSQKCQYSFQFLPCWMQRRRSLAMRILSVCPSVCLSNVCIVTKQKKNHCRFLHHTKHHLTYFSEKKTVGWGGRPLLPEMLSQSDCVGAKSPIFSRYSLVAPHRTLPLTPSKGASKAQNCRFTSKIALRLKKVCYKVSLCENCQQQSCRAFIGLTIRAKMVCGGDLF